MSRSQLKQSYELLAKPGQTFREYVVQEIELCREHLQEAIAEATKSQNGKPVFYTLIRHVSRSGMSRTISVHYVHAATGDLRHLNYVCAVLLGLAMDDLRDGVKVKGCGQDMGFALVYDLASAALGDGYGIEQRWI